MNTIPEAAGMQCPAKHHLRFRILAGNSGHHARPNGSINYIDYGLSYIAWEAHHRVRIPQNIVDAIKEIAAIIRTIAQSVPGLSRAPIRGRDASAPASRPDLVSSYTRSQRHAGYPMTSLQHASLQPPCHD